VKTVSNEKEWTSNGWLYRMRRIVGKQCLAYDLAIPSFEVHHRDVIAWRLRDARAELARAVAEEKNLPGFT
jgi:hypothetical protein